LDLGAVAGLHNAALARGARDRCNVTTLQRCRIRNSSGSRQRHLQDGTQSVEDTLGRSRRTDEVDQDAQNDAILAVSSRNSECNDNGNVSRQWVGRRKLGKLRSDGGSGSLSIESIGHDRGGRWVRCYRSSCNGLGVRSSANGGYRSNRLNIGGSRAASCDSTCGSGRSEVRHEGGRVGGRETLGKRDGGCTSRSSGDENASRGVCTLARVGDTLANRRRGGSRSYRRSDAGRVGSLTGGGECTTGADELASLDLERTAGSLRCGESRGSYARGQGGGNSDESVC